MDSLLVRNEITINAPASRVWDALTNPEQTKKYMFGSETVSDWKVGSPLLWKGSYEGKEMIFVKGNIVAIQPDTLLIYTVIDPNSGMEDIPENYLQVKYELKDENGKTKLIVTQSGFETAADGEKRYQESFNDGEGWSPILVEIKKLVETT